MKDGVVFQVGNYNFEFFDVDVLEKDKSDPLNAYYLPKPIFKKYRIKS